MLWDIRSDRSLLMILLRIQIAKMLEVQNMNLDAYYVLKESLNVINTICINQCEPFKDSGTEEKGGLAIPDNLTVASGSAK